MTPSVSILVPCYNASPWLAAAISSALGQNWPAVEVIVVDDGSTDDSLSIARSFAGRGVRVLQQPNRGAAAARNLALTAATGDFIQYLDADDLLAPDKIAAQLYQPGVPDETLTGRWGRFTNDPAQAEFDDDNPLFFSLTPRDYLLRYCGLGCMMHPAAWLVPHAVAKRAGSWNEALSLNDDGEYFARVVLASSGIRYCREAISYYRVSGSGRLSAARSRRHLESAFHALELIEQTFMATGDDPASRAAVAELCQRFAYDYFPAAPDLVKRAETRARQLGGAKSRPLGGRGFLLMSQLLGWKLARRLQVAFGKFPRPPRD